MRTSERGNIEVRKRMRPEWNGGGVGWEGVRDDIYFYTSVINIFIECMCLYDIELFVGLSRLI